MLPISLFWGQLGALCSSEPLFSWAMEIAESEHLPTPAIFATAPSGRIAENLVMSCSPSCLGRRIRKGLWEPSLLLRVPPLKPGWKGGTPAAGQGAPPGPAFTWKGEEASTASSGLAQ